MQVQITRRVEHFRHQGLQAGIFCLELLHDGQDPIGFLALVLLRQAGIKQSVGIAIERGQLYRRAQPGFRVLQIHPTGIGELELTPVVHGDGHHIVFGREARQRFFPPIRAKIGEDDDDGSVP